MVSEESFRIFKNQLGRKLDDMHRDIKELKKLLEKLEGNKKLHI